MLNVDIMISREPSLAQPNVGDLFNRYGVLYVHIS